MTHQPSVVSLRYVEKTLDELKQLEPRPLSIWREFQSMLIEEFATIHEQGLSEEEMASLVINIQNLALPLIKQVMTQESKKLADLSSYERYLLAQMIEMSLQAVKKGSIAFRFMTRINEKLAAYEQAPYEYLKGNLPHKSLHSNLKIFSWNTCLLPGGLPKISSGLAPSSERIPSIIAQIKEQDADIVCLQEVHSEVGARALYESIKDRYAHFYMNMGSKMLEKNLSEGHLNSGLFVASKYPLNSTHFEGQANHGFFWATVQGIDVGFVNCYLEPGLGQEAQKIRHEQLADMIRFVSNQVEPIRIVLGDFNIPWGSGESAEGLIKEYFFDPYNKNRSTVSEYSRTFSDVFMSHKEQGSCEILDYFLVYHVPGFEKYAFITERIEGFDEVSLKSKGSDHHGLCSQVVFPCKQSVTQLEPLENTK